jgi:hypothetical protein
MTSFMAMVVATVAGLLLRGPLDGLFGVIPGEVIGLIVGGFVYYWSRRWLKELRDE